MLLTKKQLQRIIRRSLMESMNEAEGSKKSGGSFIVAVTDDDVITERLPDSLKKSIDLSWFPSGHAYGAVITPDGSMTAFTFGPPICENPKTLAAKIMSKNPVPFLTSMTVNRRSPIKVNINPEGLTEDQAKIAVAKMKSSFKRRQLRYAVFNYIDAKSSLAAVPSNGDCRAYSIVPIGFSGSESTDADNCASMVLDALQAGGKSGFVVRNVAILTSPSAIVTALRPVCDFYGQV